MSGVLSSIAIAWQNGIILVFWCFVLMSHDTPWGILRGLFALLSGFGWLKGGGFAVEDEFGQCFCSDYVLGLD